MKERLDLTRSWVRKAESDLAVARLALDAGTALDTACFHAQQAAEKYLKAYLISRGVDFPFSHNLEKLVSQCAEHDDRLAQVLDTASELTPYAVELRYDDDFWPSAETVDSAIRAAEDIKKCVLALLPPEAATG